MANKPTGPGGYRIDIVPGDGAVTLKLAGEIDFASRQSLNDAITAVLAYGHRVLLDLRAVTFLDSTGIGGIARAMHSGVELSVVGLSPIVRRTLEVSGLAQYLQIGEPDLPAPWDRTQPSNP
jgi:anti-anti-sigma factor